MSKKKEFFLIVAFSFFLPIISYIIAEGFFSKITTANYESTNAIENIPKVKASDQKPISLLFVGDIMLDRTIRKNGEMYTYQKLFSCLEEEFSKHDAVIGNLEGTVTNFTSVSRNAAYESPESFRFTFDPLALKSLRDIGLSIVSLANNHIRDFGDEGIKQTTSNLTNLEIQYFGDPRIGFQKYTIKEINGTRIAFIPYNQFFGNTEQTLQDLNATQNISDIQIIFAHWGDEYVPTKQKEKDLAKTFINNGADLIIGAHPHVIQEDEIYKDVHIFYSLGNFIFDQYWKEAVRNGIMVQVQIKDKKIISTNKIEIESKRNMGTCLKNLQKYSAY